MEHDAWKAVAAGAEAVLVAALTVPALLHFAASKRLFGASGYGSIPGFYEDDDGEATEASTLEYSDLPYRVGAWLGSSLGLASSIAAAVLSQDVRQPLGLTSLLCRWADVVAWVSLFASTRAGSGDWLTLSQGLDLHTMRSSAQAE